MLARIWASYPKVCRGKHSLRYVGGLAQYTKECLEDNDFARTRLNNQRTGNAVKAQKLYWKERKRAHQLAKLMKECFVEAAVSFENGERALAKEIATKGRDCERMMEEEHRHAANRIFSEINPRGLHGGVIDFHGLHVKEALSKLQQLQRISPPNRVVIIITGKGTLNYRGVRQHEDYESCVNLGGSRLGPSIERYLLQRKLKFEHILDEFGITTGFEVRL